MTGAGLVVLRLSLGKMEPIGELAEVLGSEEREISVVLVGVCTRGISSSISKGLMGL